MTEKQCPPLPASFGHVHSDGNYCQDMEPSHESWPIDIYTAVQMRAYVDADRAMRAAQAAPAAWRHSRTYSVYEAAEQVPIADGDEWAEPLYLHPPEAPASQDAEDAVLSAVKLQAQIWKQEARTQAAIVRDCYQLATDATGEPGDWNGSNPVREKIVALTEARDALVADAARYRWLRERWGHLCESYEDDSGRIVGKMRCDAVEGWDVDPESLDAAIDAARAAKEGEPQ